MSDPFNKDPTVTYGAAEDVAPGVRRITCENPSPYTFTGTQTYLVGTGDVALIDPGPDRPDHLKAILAALGPGERISHILITHSHNDHSPGARPIAAETGAQVHAYGPHGAGLSPTMRRLVEQGADIGGGEGGDIAFDPHLSLDEGDRVEGGDWTLEAIHTPGHLSNHLSFALVGTGVVFTGDMIMGSRPLWSRPQTATWPPSWPRSTSLPGRGDDRLYLPGHGHPVEDPAGMVRHQVAHRQQRFEQILSALADGPKDATTLTHEIYTDVDPRLLPAARRNVLASLIGLADQGRVGTTGPVAVDAVFHLG